MHNTTEYQRLIRSEHEHWHRWGNYLSARAWGTVRETDPSHKDKAWSAVPFSAARSRAYRWAEDGIGGLSDRQQRVCLSLAF